MNRKTAALFCAALFSLPAFASAGNKIIYGVDDRTELYEVPARFRQAADSTVSLWRKNQIKPDPASGLMQLFTVNYGERYDLCPDVRFREQPVGANCSGSLVGEDLVLTAGHCIKSDSDCSAAAIVFGYGIHAAGEKPRTSVASGEVYTCVKVIKRQLISTSVSVDGGPNITTSGNDYALIQLDRKVTGHKPLAINRLGNQKKGDTLILTGHPDGLPFKFADNGRIVRPVDPGAAFFDSDLDAFHGNSGSPVFNAETGLIEGILVRGDSETFMPTFDGCSVYIVNPQNAGRGISINKLTPVLDVIPPLAEEAAAAAGAAAAVDAARDLEMPALREVSFN